jgi:NADPH-dependent 2,4-dienoyl-CoA reductase/sulfur reductase-like enzyme
MADRRHYVCVILGGGMVAGYAAKELIEQGIDGGRLCILSADNVLPVERPPLSKKFLAGQKDEDAVYINKPPFYTDNGIDVRLNTVVSGLDLSGRAVRLQSGDSIGYDRLLIATGTRPRRLSIPGADLPGLFYLRWLQDSKNIRAAWEGGARRAVILGGGYIGTEVAAVLTERGLDVTMVFPDEHLLQRVFTPEMAGFFEDYYRDRNVKLLPGQKAARLEGAGRVETVVLESGEPLRADMVVAGIGVEPVTDILEGTGLRIDDGVVVDEYLETGTPDVFAAGDVANFMDVVAGRQRRLEHWDNAVSQGEHAGRVLSGRREPYKHLSYFFSDEFDLSWELWGDAKQGRQVVYRGRIPSGKFSAWWLDESGGVVCAFVMGRPDEERDLAQQWIPRRTQVSPTVLADESKPLAAAVT